MNTDIFSLDSGDIENTQLLEMEIDTGDSPPVTHKPYTLPLQHAGLGTERIRNIRKSRGDS